MDAAFYALADPTRRAVLDLLREGGQPAGTIAQAFPVSRPAISKHLRQLLQADLVHAHSRGRQRVYQLNPQPLTAVDAWLAHYRQFWTATLADLKSFVEGGGAALVRTDRKGRRPSGDAASRRVARRAKGGPGAT